MPKSPSKKRTYEGNGQGSPVGKKPRTDLGRYLAERKVGIGSSRENADVPKGLSVVKIVSVAPPKLGQAAYHGVVGDFLRAVTPHTEATDAAVLAHLIPAIGMYIGPGPCIYAGNYQPARVNTVVVGETSVGRKGTAASPPDELMGLVDGELWKSQRVGGLSSGEGLIVKVADQRDQKGNVIKVEKRLYVVEEEFTRVLANMKREGNILSHVIRQAFDSGNLATLTVEPRQAFGAHIAIVAHVTPEELEQRFAGIEAANGFGNRFLWFYVASDKMIPRPKPIPEAIFQKVAPRLRAVGGMKQRTVDMDSAAEKYWAELYRSLREDRPGLAGAITARGPAIMLRLALIYATLDRPKRPVIGIDHLEAAKAIWDYNCESADFLFDSPTGDKFGDKLYNLIRSNETMSRKGFHRHLSNVQKALLDATLKRLESQGLICAEKVQTKGRPREVWKIVGGLQKLSLLPKPWTFR